MRGFEPASKAGQAEHTEVDAGYQIRHSTMRGKVVQIGTCGSAERKLLARSSQSIQVDRDGAVQRIAILTEAFPHLGR